MADLILHGQFIHATDLDGETGLTVTIDVYRTTISDGTTSQVVTDGACSETGGGIYRYRLASADPTTYHYVANMKTSSADVAQKHVAALGLVVPDALVGGIATIATTLQNRMGAWTGTGVNTVLGAFKAALSKSATLPSDIGGTFDPAADSAEAISEAIAGVGGATGSGAVSFPVTINDEDSNPIDGVEVWISTDSAGTSVVAGTLHTSALGVATFMLDAGTYYLWRQKSGYNFTNPVTIVVS